MLNKIALYALAISLAVNAGLITYSVALSSQKKAIQGELTLCQGVREQVQKSLEKQRELCAIKDNIISETISEQSKLEKDTDDVIAKIDLMRIQSPVILKEQVVRHTSPKESEQSVQISIDSKLPDSLVRMLSEHCLRSKGSPCTSP